MSRHDGVTDRQAKPCLVILSYLTDREERVEAGRGG
jgi:hypothetical protein